MSVNVKFKVGLKKNINTTFNVENKEPIKTTFRINARTAAFSSLIGNPYDNNALAEALNVKASNEALTALATTVTNNYTTLDTKIDGVQLDLSGNISMLNTKVEGYNTALSNRIDTLSGTVSNNYTTLDGKINTNTSNITAINNTLSGYGNIVTHNVAEFATSAQGLLADTALQPNDNISELNNNVGYITGISSADVTNALGYTPYNATNPNGYITGINSTDVVTALGYTPYDSANPDGYITSASLPTVNNNTITIQKNNTNIGSFTLNQSSNDTINITVPTDTQDLTNGAGFITSAALPTLSDLATNTQMAAIDSGATAEKIDQINTNTGDISNEIINRQLADNTLQSQIDAIVASSDVFDIVGTYAELQAYDITTVPVNDIIKVLVDSTHNNAATYYRCVENNNVKSWSYIGSEGAYYTKGEADSKFVGKTITINGQPLSSNITLTASDVNALPSSTTIGAGILTVQKNGTNIDTFGANDTGNTTINITVPTDTGDLTNNAGFITGITGTDVTNALGYTPYDSSNPNGYTSNVGTVTSVNNISPVSGNVTLSIPTTTSDLTNDSGFITSSDLTNYVTTNTDQNITGTKTFVGQKKIGFKQSSNTDKLGFTLYTSNNTEKGYLEFNPANKVDNVPLMTLGNWAASSDNLTHVGFRKYSGITNESGAYNLLAPLISEARTPFDLTTTYKNFYLPLGFTDGTTTVKTAKSGLVDLSSLLPNSAEWGNITGTLSNQTDLQNALNLKVNSSDLATVATTGSYTDLINKPYVTTNAGITYVGGDSSASTSGTALGYSAKTTGAFGISIGRGAKSKADYAYQIGLGNNTTSYSLSIGFGSAKTYTLLDGNTGLIPDARISTNIARTSQLPSLATNSTAGKVQPDGNTITVSNGVISATPARNIGEIVQSTIPLTDAGLHLLDGSLISGSGSYADFVTYIAGLVNNYPDLFETEANWQQTVTTYGVCGKFVYDSVNNTVRLPKVTGIIEGTVDATALGDLVEAGLPNITGVLPGIRRMDTLHDASLMNKALHWQYGNSPQTSMTQSVTGDVDFDPILDASVENSIYGNSTTVQPQTIKAFIYIVIATSAKTEIQVDIDEIATDLNGKADTDLSNITTVNTQITTTAINPIVNKLTNADITVAPSSDIDTGIIFRDNNNINLAGFTTTRFANGVQSTAIVAINKISGTEKTAYFKVYVNPSGNDIADGSAGVKSTIANWAMPSGTSYAVAFDASGYFTASQDGYLTVSVHTNSPSGFYLNNTSNGLTVSYTVPYAGWDANGYIPMAKGQTVSCYIVDGYMNTGFPKFIPCIGG